MYNRYIRRDDGTYTKVSEAEPTAGQGRGTATGGPDGRGPKGGDTPPRSRTGPDGPPPEADGPAHTSGTGPPPFSGTAGAASYLRRVLDQLHLDRIDAGDLLLLGLLYFLFREKADEELLIALGLLLIL